MGTKEKFVGAPKWEDKGFIIAFAVWFIATAIVSLMGFSNGDYDSISSSGSSTTSDVNYSLVFAIIFVPLIVSIGFTVLWIRNLRDHAEKIIKGSFIITIGLMFVFALAMMVVSFVFGIFMLLIALFYCWIVSRWWPRIPYVALILSNCCAVLLRYPSSLTLTYSWILVLFLWLVVVVLMAVGIVGFSDGDSMMSLGYGLLVLLALWGSNALIYIHHCTICGLIATWYFMDGKSGMPESPVKASFKRATTTSLGTVLFGALVIAIIQIIHAIITSMLNDMKRSSNPAALVCACILQCIINLIKRAAEYFTKYLFVNVSMYGNGFVTAGKATYALFKRSGVSNLISDLIIDKVQFTGQLFAGILSGVVCALVGYVLGDSDTRTTYMILFAFVGLIMGFIMADIGLTAVDSSVKALIVCLAEEPEVLEQNSPELYEEFRQKSAGLACFSPGYGRSNA